MSHNITTRDGVFAVRDAGWHGLATALPDYPTREVAQSIAHPWEPVTEPVYRRVPIVADDGSLLTQYEEIPDQRAVVRSDNNDVLGVVSGTYEPVQNSEMYDIAEAIEAGDPSSVKYETGGSLLGGRKVWLLLCLREPLTIKGDPHGETIPYFGLQNAHDGSGAFRGQALFTKIICDNTAQAADLEAGERGTEFAFSHTKNVMQRIEEAKAALAGWRESVQRYRLMNEHLVSQSITDAQREWFIEQFIPMPAPHTVSERVVANVEDAWSTMRGIFASETQEGIANTAYGLVQGAIEYQQHYRKARSAETRFKRQYLDRSTVTSDALELATQAWLV